MIYSSDHDAIKIQALVRGKLTRKTIKKMSDLFGAFKYFPSVKLKCGCSSRYHQCVLINGWFIGIVVKLVKKS